MSRTGVTARRIVYRLAAFAAGALALLSPAIPQTTYEYDAQGRLTKVIDSHGAFQQTYGYDAAGNRVSAVTAVPGAVSFSIGNASANAGGDLSFTVTKSGTTFLSHNVSYATANGTAIVNTHYESETGVLSFGPTETTKSVTVETLSNSVPSGSRVMYVNLSNATNGATIASAQGAGTITPTPAFSQTIQITGSGPVNLRSLANAAGYNGAQNATITFQVGSSVTIRGSAGTPTGGIAIDTGTWPTGSYAINLTLQVSGKVYGGGGRGGAGAGASTSSTAGGSGGDAVYARLPMSITVNSGGQIRAGGGGGGGGGAVSFNIPPSGSGWAGGGGGGGGFPNAAGGAGGSAPSPGQNGSAGASGTNSGGGAGGAGGPNGGNGGNAAGTGSAGQSANKPGSSGGSPGYAVRRNGHSVPVTNNGTISGTVG